MRLQDALDKYILQLRADGRSDHTIHQYRRHVRLLDRWLQGEGRDHSIDAVDHEVIALFMVSDSATLTPDGRPKKATSTNALRSSLRTFFGYLHAAGLTCANSARLLRRARCGTPPPRALSEDEQQRLLEALDGAVTPEERRDRVLFRLMLATGIRIGSALALDVGDVDLEAGELWLRTMKNDRPNHVFLPPATVEMLRPFVENRTGPLFTGRGGRRLGARHVQRRLATWLQQAGMTRPASPHSLRHSFATRLLEKTGNLVLVKEALNHLSIASTLVYLRGREEELRQVLAG